MDSAPHIDPSDPDRHQPSWIEDFADLSVDELRELPNHIQLGLDLSVLD